jgi:hypothetical protein
MNAAKTKLESIAEIESNALAGRCSCCDGPLCLPCIKERLISLDQLKPLVERVSRVIDVCPNGLGRDIEAKWEPLTGGTNLQLIQVGIAFLSTHKIPTDVTSYSLKHGIERWGRLHGLIGPSCPNGAAIVAAVLSGYRICRIRKSKLNCKFKPKKKTPTVAAGASSAFNEGVLL